MTRTAVVQIDIPMPGAPADGMLGYCTALSEYSRFAFGRVARAWSAEHIVLTSQRYGTLHPCYEKFRIFSDEFAEFDTIVYVDADVVPRGIPPMPDCAPRQDGRVQMMALLETQCYAGRQEGASEVVRRATRRFQPYWHRLFEQDALMQTSAHWLNTSYFNSGVMVCDRRLRTHIRSVMNAYITEHPMHDQNALNRMCFEHDIRISPLSYRYNSMLHCVMGLDALCEAICSSYFVHFSGDTKSLFANLPSFDDPEAVKLGIAQWIARGSCSSRWSLIASRALGHQR